MKYSTLFLSLFAILLFSCKEKPSEKIALQTLNNSAFNFKVDTIVSGMEIP